MGGSGGDFSSSSGDYKKILEEIKEETEDKAFETKVGILINNILSDFNIRENSEIIKKYIDIIKICIEDEIGESIDLRFSGSYEKHTYVDGLSDVDILILINKLDLERSSPKEVLEIFKSHLQEMHCSDIKYITTGRLAVTVTLTDGNEIQLLPAIKKGDGYKISAEDGNNWSNIIRPDKFARRLTEINQSCGRKVVPVIKLVKGLNTQLPEAQQLKGYHIESIAIEAFKSYPDSYPKTPKVMLKYFFEKAKDIIKNPIKDKTGQSRNVDDYLGSENSPKRLQISNTLDIIYRRMKFADEVGQVSQWEKILG